MAEIEIEINGQKLTATPDQTVIQVADAAGIYIPRFCYHPHLSIAANCRMCLVEVEKCPKPMPACATPVMPGMKVFTKSPKTIAAQRAVMEFLLINHPLDCPICDQGGECELQDLSMGYGAYKSEYTECKRSIADENIGPLIATDMTRCIYCTRCVRFGKEIAGLPELGAIGRGEDTEISTYVAHAIHSEISGNIIDLCPVGALTSKPYRFTARAWELQQAPSISPHDCIGSHLNIHTRDGEVKRVVTRACPEINEAWLSDRDRFSYTALQHPQRLCEPRVRIHGKWQTVTWQQALEIAAEKLHQVLVNAGPEQFAALASPSSTTEELYLLQKLTRALGSPHIDHRLRAMDTSDQSDMPLYPGMPWSLTELEQQEAIVLIGSHLQKEQPLVALRLRKAARRGTTIVAVNPVDYRFTFPLEAKQILAPQHWVSFLSDVLSASPSESAAAFLKALQGKSKVAILLGALAINHPDAATVRYLAKQLAHQLQAQVGFLTEGANAAGAWLAGAVPHREAGGQVARQIGCNAYELWAQPRQAYLLLNVDPDLDCANAQQALTALQQATCTIALSLFQNPALETYADVILPIAPFTETAGTFINAMGEWQSFQGVAKPFASARPAWKVLRVFAQFLQLDGFEYESAEAIKHALQQTIKEQTPFQATRSFQPKSAPRSQSSLMRIGEIPLYAIDSLTRHAKPLQETQVLMEGEVATIRLHPETARAHGLVAGAQARVRQGDHVIELPVAVDAAIAKEAVWLAGALEATNGLGDLFGPINLQKMG